MVDWYADLFSVGRLCAADGREVLSAVIRPNRDRITPAVRQHGGINQYNFEN